MCDFPFAADKVDYLLLSFDSVVILACFVSLILCLRSIISGVQLQYVSAKKKTLISPQQSEGFQVLETMIAQNFVSSLIHSVIVN